MLKYNRINFVGTQSTGKTTILNVLKEDPRFKDFTFHTEMVRTLMKEGLPINEEGTSVSQKTLFDRANEILDQMMEIPSVSDRCIIDVASYTTYLFNHAVPENEDYNNLSAEDFRERKEIVRRKNDFGLLVYFPIEFALTEDGVRSTNEDFRQEVDQKIRQFLNNYKIPHIEVHGTVEQRVAQIKEALGIEIEP